MTTRTEPNQRLYTEAKMRAVFILDTLSQTEFPSIKAIKKDDPRLYQELVHLIAESGVWWSTQNQGKDIDLKGETEQARVFLHKTLSPPGDRPADH